MLDEFQFNQTSRVQLNSLKTYYCFHLYSSSILRQTKYMMLLNSCSNFSFFFQLQNILNGDTDGWTRKASSFLHKHVPIMNPHAKIVQQWNKFFVVSCLIAIFIDPLFFFLLSSQQVCLYSFPSLESNCTCCLSVFIFNICSSSFSLYQIDYQNSCEKSQDVLAENFKCPYCAQTLFAILLIDLVDLLLIQQKVVCDGIQCQ